MASYSESHVRPVAAPGIATRHLLAYGGRRVNVGRNKMSSVYTRSRQANGRRRLLWTLLAAAVIAAGAAVVWQTLASRSRPPMRYFGSPQIVEPIGALQLISAMEPPDHRRVDDMAGAAVARSDRQIHDAIDAKLDHMDLPAGAVDIRVDDRQVVLSGRLADSLVRDAVEVAVRSVAGVRTVANDIDVPTP